MDKIWYRNPSKSEVIGRCGREEKTEWPRRTDKSRTLKTNKKPTKTINAYYKSNKEFQVRLLSLKVSFFSLKANIKYGSHYACVKYS